MRQVKSRLAKRIRAARDYRKKMLEETWRSNERAAYGGYDDVESLQQAVKALVEDTADFDLGETIEINYAFRNLRFLHAQMSANPPVATPRPESSDLEDQRAANAADQCMQWFLRQLNLQEVVDLVALDCLVYGTGIARTGFNPNAGDIVDFDEESGELELEGEIEVVRVSPWRFYIDPAAEVWDRGFGARYVLEEIELTEDEVKSQFPDKWNLFRAHRGSKSSPGGSGMESGSIVGRSALSSDQTEQREDKYTFFAYFEPGFPENGMLGRFLYCFEDGTPITAPTVNPNMRRPAPSLAQRKKFRETGVEPKRKPATAYLPYHLLTDIDVPGMVWGRSFLQYAAPSQNLMRSIDSAMLEAVKVHGVARMVLPPGAKIAEDSLSNSNVDVIQIEDEGNGEIKFVNPPGLPPAMTELRTNVRQGVDDMAGMNESMLGQTSREQAAALMQYAVNQGSMIRRRLFNKYVLFIESMYRGLLSLAIQHWDDAKMIKVLGEEGAFDVVELRGIDLDGGYEIVTEYGTSLPLDPQARRDEILKLMPIYKDAGLDPKVLVANLKLADLKGDEDVIELARRRAKEIVDTIIAKRVAGPKPRYGQDAAGMLAYCRQYVMTSSYFALDDFYKDLIEQWMQQLAQQAASEEPGTPGAGAGAVTPATGAGGLPATPVSAATPPGTPPPAGAPAAPAPGAPSLGAAPAGAPAALATQPAAATA